LNYVVSFPTGQSLRERLIARLVRAVVSDHRRTEDVTEILRAGIGAALAHDLSDAETQWLISGIEGQLGLSLTPLTRSA
jgi:hypothetical protein